MNAATEDAFPYGADVRVLDPAAGKGAEAAQQEASEAAQVTDQCFFITFWGASQRSWYPNSFHNTAGNL